MLRKSSPNQKISQKEFLQSKTPDDIRDSQKKVLRALLVYGPMTDEEIYLTVTKHGQMSPSGVRTRRSELVKRDLVRKTDMVKYTVSNRRTAVWAAI